MNMKSLLKRIVWRLIKTRFFNRFRTRISHTQFYILQGKTKKTNSGLSILVFANENIVNYISDLAFSEKAKINASGNTTVHKIPSVIANTKPDIVLVDSDGIFSNFLSKTFLLLPYVISTLDISASWETIYAKMKRIRRRNILKIESLSYSYEVTSEPDKLSYFYHKMYLPFISKNRVRISGFTPIVSAKETFSKGGLLLVKSNGEYVSGILYHIENGTLHCTLLAYEKGIAGQAALYFLIKWAKEKGYAKIDYGTTPPFMNDGLYLYKRSWGMKVNDNSKRILAIRFCNFEKAVQDFLFDNPFVFTNSASLSGAILSDTNDVNPPSLYRKYYTSGLDNLRVFYPAKGANSCQMPVSEGIHTPALNGVNSLTKIALEKNFVTKLVDFSKER